MLRLFSLIFLAVAPCPSQSHFWQAANGPYGGSITYIATDGDNTLFAAHGRPYSTITQGPAIYRSTDNGASWSPALHLSERFLTEEMVCSRSGDVYAAISSDSGIWYSSNHGTSWIKRGEHMRAINSLVVDSQDVVYAGTPSYGIYRSKDKGTTWTRLSAIGTAGPDPFVRCLKVRNGYELFAGTYEGLFFSTDQGEQWTHLPLGLLSSDVVGIMFKDSLLFVGIFGHRYTGIYRSSDRGLTWQNTSAGLPQSDDTPYFTPYFGHLSINPHTGNLFIALRYRGMYRSTDNGDTWHEIHTGLWDYYVYSLLATSQGNLFLTTDKTGIYRSADDGEHWEPTTKGLMATGISYLSINTATGSLFANMGGITVYRTTDKGTSWTIANNGMDPKESIEQVRMLNETELLVEGSAIYRSDNDGENWHLMNPSIYIDTLFRYHFSRTSGEFYATNSHSLCRWLESEQRWKQVYVSPPYGAAAIAHNPVSNREGVLFASHYLDPRAYTYGMASSTDRGETWNVKTFPTVQQMIVTDQGDVFAATEWGLYHNAHGNEWTYFGSGRCAYIKDGTTYAGYTSGQVTISTADTFFATAVMGEGFPVSAIVVDKEGYVYAGTGGYGVYRTKEPLSITGVEKNDDNTPLKYELMENYPNPFNPATNVRFTIAPLPAGGKRDFASLNNLSRPGGRDFAHSGLSTMQHVTINVYNILGEEVATLINEARPPGEYSITWNAESLPSGIYLIRMTAGEFQATRKAVFIR